MRWIGYITICLSIALSLAIPLTAVGGKLYRWTDNEGHVHYTDKVPPEFIRKERTRLDARGIEVERIDAAKTKEEIARDNELMRLRAEKQRLIDEQNASDRVLLNTYRSEDDIKMARDGKLASIDSHIQIARVSIKRIKQKLEEMQKGAADLERQGKGIPKSYLDEIQSTRQQIKQTYAHIINKERNKEHLWNKHQDFLERFRKLKNLEPQKPGLTPAEKADSLLETVVVCADEATCNASWERAESYVRRHASTKLQMLSQTIIMTASPIKDNEYSLTVARIRKKDGQGAEIFLDLQCKSTPRGKDACKSEKINKIRDGFSIAIGAPG